MYTRYGGFIKDVDKFDPLFFGMSPREAQSMDPQQRLLLEVAWEALENAGLAPDQLGGSATGVYIGVTMSDYLQVLSNLNSPDLTGTYRITGNLQNSIPGRVSYTLGFHGPAMAIDTACSSSLVAIHQAVQSLRNGETSMALAGGVNLLLSPEMTLSACQASMLAPDGRCKTFDSRADGFIRSDGVAVVVLKRYSDAVRDGDNIWALIRGSAVNHDGFSSGFSVPSKLAQEAVIKSALANAGLSSEYVGYVEAHGTGTSLGDPIEVRALEATFGSQRNPNSPVFLGSVKTNIGHTEGTAGVTGLIKAVLALHYSEIPPHLHLRKLSPFMDWSRSPFRIPKQPTPFPTIKGRQVAGVSSFGVSGINAHIILEAAPRSAKETTAQTTEMDRPYHVLSLSAQTAQALHEQAERVANYIRRHPGSSLADVAFTANTGRAQFNHRLGITASNCAEMEVQLAGFIAGKQTLSFTPGTLEHDSKTKIAFLFSGHGSQYVNMGRSLYETSPVFQKAVKDCEILLQPYLDVPISKVLYPQAGEENAVTNLWGGMKYTQPAQFVLAYALVTLWKSWGIKPGAVIGHSVGEYAAACAAGVISLADGIKLVTARGQLVESLPERGAMSAVFAHEATVATAIAPYSDRVSIAVINGPTNIVISGQAQAVESIEAELAKQEIKTKRLDVAQASHSPTVDPMLIEFESIAASCTYHEPNVQYISSLTGKLTTHIDSKYWQAHQRKTVRFADALDTLLAQGYTHLIEIGPTPTLITIAQRNLDGIQDTPTYYASLRKGQDDWAQMLNSLAGLYVHGTAVDWRGFDQPYLRHRVTLPTYPFQRQRYWAAAGSRPRNTENSANLHPLLGTRIRSATKEIIFENTLTSLVPAFLADHVVNEQVILPATAYTEIFLAAGRHTIKNSSSFVIESLMIYTPLPLSEAATIQTIVEPKTEHDSACQIFSYDKAKEQWRLHASAVVHSSSEQPSRQSVAEIKARCSATISTDEHYLRMAERGLRFGPAFRGVNSLHLGKNEVLARVELPVEVFSERSSYFLHPAIFDAALQSIANLLPEGNKTYLPMSIDSVSVFRRIETGFWSYITLRDNERSGADIITADAHLFDVDGRLLVAIAGFTLKKIASAQVDSWLYEVQWQKADREISVTANALAETVRPSLARLAKEPGMIAYQQEFLPRMDVLCAAFIQNAMIDMGWSFETRSTFTLNDASTRLKVARQHQRLLARLLDILEEENILSRHGDTWIALRPLVKTDAGTNADKLRAGYPDAKIEVDMVERFGRELAAGLQGQRNPLELLFPGGSLTDAESLYRERAIYTRFQSIDSTSS